MRYLLAAITLIISSVAFSAEFPVDLNVSYTLPTLYVDGTDIQPGDLASARIECNRHSGEVAVDELLDVSAELPGADISQLVTAAFDKPGTYTCRAYAITVDGTSSDASGEVSVKYTGKPQPPVNVRFN